MFERWTLKWVALNYWRVRHIVDSREDAVQECAVVFAKIARKYGDSVSSPAHFMALYIRAVVNTWNTLARNDERERSVVLNTSVYDLENYQVDNLSSSMAASLIELSNEGRQMLQTMITAPSEVIDFVMAGRHQRRDTINRRELNILGFTRHDIPAIDEVTELVGKK